MTGFGRRTSPRSSCEGVRAQSGAKLADIHEKTRSLEAMRKVLANLSWACSGRGPAMEGSLPRRGISGTHSLRVSRRHLGVRWTMPLEPFPPKGRRHVGVWTAGRYLLKCQGALGRPLDDPMILCSQFVTARARLFSWLLVFAVTVLPGASLQKRYHCRVTGVRDLPACCCAKGNDCTPEPSSCDSGGCGSAEEKETGGDECGCCDVTFERTGGDLAVAPEASRPDGPSQQIALLPPDRVWSQPVVWCGTRTLENTPRRWTGPPVYLLHRSLLI